MAGDYISREAAVKDFEENNARNPNWTPQRVKTLLLRQPGADVAEVVRCKKLQVVCGQQRWRVVWLPDVSGRSDYPGRRTET